jgi:hypothetical protein
VKRLQSFGGLLAVMVIAPLCAVAGLYLYGAAHPVLPGLNGCRYVRSQEPRIDCYADQIDSLVRAHGVTSAMATVDAEAKHVSRAADACHLAWHPTGERAGRTAAKQGKELTLLEDGSFCSEGYIHGFYIGYLAASSTHDVGAKELNTICTATKESNIALQCVHAFGHQFARQSKDSAVGSRACLKVDLGQVGEQLMSGPQGMKHECLYGMWMQYSMQNLKHEAANLDNCAAAIPGAKQVCYEFLPFRVDRLTGDLTRAANSCSRYAKARSDRDACVAAFSRRATMEQGCSIFHTKADRSVCTRARRQPL